MDSWDDAGAFLFRFLPEMTISEHLVGERSMLTITGERDKWWLQNDREQGSSCYPTKEEAKAAGDRIMSKAEAEHDIRILEQAGLAPDGWEIRLQDGLSLFHSQLDILFVLDPESEYKNPIWDIYRHDDQIAAGCPTADLQKYLTAS